VFFHEHVSLLFGCTKSLLIDGGGSTQILYKADGAVKTAMISGGRDVRCMIALTTAAANNCNWGG